MHRLSVLKKHEAFSCNPAFQFYLEHKRWMFVKKKYIGEWWDLENTYVCLILVK